ncbi:MULTISPECIES: Arc family DNA-binding protein [Thiothrix]|uniref:Arc family DNA-binding protein n=1 Tax=Thiothrix subterranea TaxID=2735563 RepID=A0AA51MP16_9GAMM|nr:MULTISPECIES: Arc family DNA-binding protein [Thiothrix]MDQ5770828.1 Arc family DNA-binding protein [Thiothrix subterranea]WML87254.1 Arc family DNA-binding protein [Thiothrix subterranea]
MSRDVNPFGLRMPPEVKEELEKLAEQNRRSLNAEIIVRLEESIRREKDKCISEDGLRRIVSEELDKRRQ